MRTLPLVALVVLLAPRIAGAQASLSVTPAYAFITKEAPYGSFLVTNDGTEHLEVVVLAEYGVIESDPEGTSTHVTLGSAGRLGNLAETLTFFPKRLVLEPGRGRVVRFMAAPGTAGIALMHFRMQERAAVADAEIPEVAAVLGIVYNLVAPVVLLEFGEPRLWARVLAQGPESLTVLLVNESPHPFVGGVTVAADAALGRTESAVYTRRRVVIPLSGPLPSGPLRLEFDNRYRGLSAEVRESLVAPAPVRLR